MKLDVPANVCEDFPTLRMQQPDFCKCLWENVWYHPEPCCCLILAVYTVLDTGFAICML